MTVFTLDVSHAQIDVFDPRLSNPFNDWFDGHVAQGFSWRPGSVSFSTLESAGKIAIEAVRSDDDEHVETLSERAIVVPFTVPDHGEIEIATISLSMRLEMPPGQCGLFLMHCRSSNGAMWATLRFCLSTKSIAAKVLRADSALSPPSELELLMQASLA
jgi:hypothetical protein